MADATVTNDAVATPGEAALLAALGTRSIVLVGMMGSGKSSIGRRLAARLAIPFVDADSEIEAAAGMTIPEIFETHGEPYFRAGEARVIARLLEQGPQVLATGGGAFGRSSAPRAFRSGSRPTSTCCSSASSGAATGRCSRPAIPPRRSPR